MVATCSIILCHLASWVSVSSTDPGALPQTWSSASDRPHAVAGRQFFAEDEEWVPRRLSVTGTASTLPLTGKLWSIDGKFQCVYPDTSEKKVLFKNDKECPNFQLDADGVLRWQRKCFQGKAMNFDDNCPEGAGSDEEYKFVWTEGKFQMVKDNTKCLWNSGSEMDEKECDKDESAIRWLWQSEIPASRIVHTASKECIGIGVLGGPTAVAEEAQCEQWTLMHGLVHLKSDLRKCWKRDGDGLVMQESCSGNNENKFHFDAEGRLHSEDGRCVFRDETTKVLGVQDCAENEDRQLLKIEGALGNLYNEESKGCLKQGGGDKAEVETACSVVFAMDSVGNYRVAPGGSDAGKSSEAICLRAEGGSPGSDAKIKSCESDKIKDWFRREGNLLKSVRNGGCLAADNGNKAKTLECDPSDPKQAWTLRPVAPSSGSSGAGSGSNSPSPAPSGSQGGAQTGSETGSGAPTSSPGGASVGGEVSVGGGETGSASPTPAGASSGSQGNAGSQTGSSEPSSSPPGASSSSQTGSAALTPAGSSPGSQGNAGSQTGNASPPAGASSGSQTGSASPTPASSGSQAGKEPSASSGSQAGGATPSSSPSSSSSENSAKAPSSAPASVSEGTSPGSSGENPGKGGENPGQGGSSSSPSSSPSKAEQPGEKANSPSSSPPGKEPSASNQPEASSPSPSPSQEEKKSPEELLAAVANAGKELRAKAFKGEATSTSSLGGAITAVFKLTVGDTPPPLTVPGTGAGLNIPASALSALGVSGDVAAVASVFDEESLAQMGAGETAPGETIEVTSAMSVEMHSPSAPLTVAGLAEPIVVSLPKTGKTKGGEECAFWDKAKKKWSSEGVVTKKSADGSLKCETKHLTLFAAILRGFLAAFSCAQLSLLSSKGLENFADPSWLHRPMAIILWCLLAVIAALFFIAYRVDQKRNQTWTDECFLLPSAGVPETEQKSGGCMKCFGGKKKGGAEESELTRAAKVANGAVDKFVMMSMRLQTSATLWLSPDVVDFVCTNKDFQEILSAEKGSSNAPTGKSWNELNRTVLDCMHQQWKSLDRCCSIPLLATRIFIQAVPIVNVYLLCPFRSSCLRLLLLTTKLFGSLFIGALFFQASGDFLDKGAGKECSTQGGVGEMIGRIIAIGIASLILAALPMFALKMMHTRKVVKVDSVDGPLWKKQLKKWRNLDRLLWLLALIYCGFCLFFIMLFVANIHPDDTNKWGTSGVTSMVKDELVIPLSISVLVPLLAITVLEIANKMALGSDLRMHSRIEQWKQGTENPQPQSMSAV